MRFNKATELPSAGNMDSDPFARERGAGRDFVRSSRNGMSGGNTGGRQFDRSNYNGDFKRGAMGGA
jgi:hypothetical protein